MLTSEFNTEMGALIRSLESKVRLEPTLSHPDGGAEDALDQIDRAIISLIAIRLRLQRDTK